MLELPHTIAGAVIATKLGNPLLAFPLAFLSNFILDLLPHWNPHLNTELAKYGKITRKTFLFCLLDVSLALSIGLFLAFRFWPDVTRVAIILSSCFLAVLADLAEAPYFFLGIKHKFIMKLIDFQRRIQFNVPLLPGLISQAIFLVIAFWLLLS